MFSFDSSTFAIAGAIAAAGPIIIHLLNRRRFRTISWAAMDFLREALERNRKILHLRDILLLALRMLTAVLFGLVLAKPFFKGAASAAFWQAGLLGFSLLLVLALAVTWATASKGRGRVAGFGLIAALLFAGFQLSGFDRQSSVGNVTSSRAPVHAVLVVDNSRSLGVESLGGTLLDRARGKAAEFIDALPPESRITVIPMAGSEDPFSLDAYRNKEDARRALERIKIVDTEGSVRGALELADQACQQSFDLPSKRVVVLTDGQANAWKESLAPELIQRLSGLQIVNVATGPARNVWVSGFHIEDGLTSAEVPCRLLARIHASETEMGAANAGSTTESFEVQAKLTIDGSEVASQAVEMVPGQEREIEFSYQFDQIADPLRPTSILAAVSVQADLQSADQLPGDNRQQIVLPIVSSMPVVFVDQYGDDENLDQGKVGETYALRHLMAPRASSDKSQRRLIHVEHVRADQVTQELLETARLVVVAGLEKPDDATVTLLDQFVRQGGPLVILAGGQFDPAAWTERAWRGGRGILPSPLEPKAAGETPEETSKQLQPFFASFTSMQHDFFLIEGEDPQSLASLFEATPFFKAVQADVGTQTLDELLKSDTNQFTDEKQFLERYASRHEAGSHPTDSDEDDRRFRGLEPAWWQWRSPLPLVDRSLSPDELAKRAQPRMLAQYDGNGRPFVLERRVGAGRVVLFTSGVTSNWNLLRGSGAMYLFHRTFCQLMEQTLPRRNFVAGQKISQPIERRTDTRLSVTRPSGVKESLSIDAISPTVSGVTVRRPVVAGTYAIISEQNDSTSADSTTMKVDEILLAVNGAESESNLASISVSELQQKLGHDEVHVLAVDQPIRLEGGARRGLDLWKLFGWSVLACLLLEKAILAWSSVGNRQLQR